MLCGDLYSKEIQKKEGIYVYMDFPVAAVVKNPTASAGGTKDMDSIPGLGRSPGVGNGNLLQYSCLENLMDKGVWRLESVGSQRVRQD